MKSFLSEKKPVKKTERTLFTTEATQQKEHTTHNLYICIRCHFRRAILPMREYNCRVRTPKAAKTEATKQKQHTTQNFIRCHFGPLLFALAFAPYIYPAILHRCSHLAFFLRAFPMVAFCIFASYM